MNTHTGKRIPRLDGPDKAAGKAMYAGDYSAPNMLEAAVVRSTQPHARIVKINLEDVDDDVFIFSASDLHENIVEDIIEDQPLLADGIVRFWGEPILVVAAETREKARRAARMAKIEYEPLPVITDAKQAFLNPPAQLHAKGNTCSFFEHEKGDVEQAFRACDLTLEDEFEVPMQDHAYMEPDATFSWIENGKLHLRVSSQNVFHDKRMVCRALGLSPEEVCVSAAVVGGGFGGKDGHVNQVFAALATWKTGRPVRIVNSREETLCATYKRHAARMRIKAGFSKTGKILAYSVESFLDTGAYAGLGPAVLGLFSEHVAGPYEIPNVKIITHLMYTNKAVGHAMRGFGVPQSAFAQETILSRAAEILGVDPIEIRMMNALTKGAIGALGQTMEHSVGIKEALEAIKNSAFWKGREQNEDPFVGYGIAAGHLSCGLGKSIPDSAKVQIEDAADGRYILRMGLVDIGQGSMTALAAIAADALDTDINNIDIIMADTEETFDCGSVAGSRSIFIGGNAILAAAEEYKKNCRGSGKKAIGESKFPESSFTLPLAGFPHAMYTFIAQAAKIKINPLTGQVTLLDILAVTEAGHVINPLQMDGQIQGGIVMSIGYAMGENVAYKNGVPVHTDFSTYLLPTAMDVSPISNVSLEAYEESGPLGAKGAAEVATVVIAPAINAAIRSVCGADFTSLPINAECILKFLNNK